MAPIPASATAVVVNLTAAGGTSASYLSAYAAGATPATTSSLNFTAGETVANRDIVNVGTGGQIEVYNFAGRSTWTSMSTATTPPPVERSCLWPLRSG